MPRKYGRYKCVNLPTDPSQWIPENAVAVQKFCDLLIAELNKLLNGKLTKQWFEEDAFDISTGGTIWTQRRFTPDPSAIDEGPPKDQPSS